MIDAAKLEWEIAGSRSNVVKGDGVFRIDQRPASDWQMRHGGVIYRPFKGDEPNWFHRKMQQLCFGFKWERVSWT